MYNATLRMEENVNRKTGTRVQKKRERAAAGLAEV